MSKLVGWLAEELPKYWKTAIATVPVIVFVGAEVVQAIQDGSVDGSLSMSDVLRIAITAGTAYAVYKKSNAPATGV